MLVCLTLFYPNQSKAVSVELSGAVGSPIQVSGEQRHYSVGGIATVIFSQAGPFYLGGGIGYDKFDNKHDDGGVSFKTLFFEIRLPFVRTGRFRFFGVFAPEYAIQRTLFYKQSQGVNPPLPSSQWAGNVGLALGTGISLKLAGDWLSFVSTQKVHFIAADVDGTRLFVVNFGIALSN